MSLWLGHAQPKGDGKGTGPPPHSPSKSLSLLVAQPLGEEGWHLILGDPDLGNKPWEFGHQAGALAGGWGAPLLPVAAARAVVPTLLAQCPQTWLLGVCPAG